MSYPFQPSPSYTFSVAKKIQSHFILPEISKGPGQYNPKLYKKGGTLDFGQYSQRKLLLKLDTITPSPVHYTIHTERNQGISFTNSRKSFIKPQNLSPGPGSYLLNNESHSKIGGIIAKTSREHRYDTDTPGVGKYNSKSTLNQLGYRFKQIHSRHRSQQVTPGPGYYSQHQENSQAVKMCLSTRKWSYIQKIDTPGPGSYQNDSTIQNRSLSSQSKSSSKQNSKILTKLSTKIKQQKLNSQSIQKSELLNTNQKQQQQSKRNSEDINYQRLQEYGKLQISFAKQTRKEEYLDELNTPNLKKVNRSPGPAQYAEIIFKPNKKLGFMGRAEKISTFVPKEGPGVGAYNTIQNIGKIYNQKKKQVSKVYKLKDINTLEFDI